MAIQWLRAFLLTLTSTLLIKCLMRCFTGINSTNSSFFKFNIFHSFFYKLTDFGAARELEAHEGFMSVYGTEEYLVGQILSVRIFSLN